MTRPQLNSLADTLALRRDHRDHSAGARPDRVQVRQADHPAAEHVVPVEHLDQDRARSAGIELLGREPVVFPLQFVGHVPAEHGVRLRIVAHRKVLGL